MSEGNIFASVEALVLYSRDCWYPILTKPFGLVLHIVLFIVLGFIIRIANGVAYNGDNARVDATRGMSLTMYFALFLGLLDVKGLNVLFANGVALIEIIIAVVYGIVQELSAFLAQMRGPVRDSEVASTPPTATTS